jgi:hypothetical protein
MRKLITFLIQICILPLIAFAVDSTEDYTKELLGRTDVEYWRDKNGHNPPGGYLFRCEYDITGDGRNELFLASTLECEEYEIVWTVYSPDAQQNFTKIGSGISFRPADGFYLKISGTQRELQTVYRNAKFGLGIINRYTIPASGALTHVKHELTA